MNLSGNNHTRRMEAKSYFGKSPPTDSFSPEMSDTEIMARAVLISQKMVENFQPEIQRHSTAKKSDLLKAEMEKQLQIEAMEKPIEAIRKLCLHQCCLGQPEEVRLCQSRKTCDLWPYRMAEELMNNEDELVTKAMQVLQRRVESFRARIEEQQSAHHESKTLHHGAISSPKSQVG